VACDRISPSLPTVLLSLKDPEAFPVGLHCLLELYDCPVRLLDDVDFIQKVLQQGAERARSTLIQQITHQFHPQGVTALALLAESHISIHTWTEVGYAAMDVFTCGRDVRPEEACKYFVQVFEAKHHVLIQVPRQGPRRTAGGRADV
jgi:S-adenosylmethionine decarboxylase